MSDQKYLKATCQGCGGHIEFPAEGLGMVVPCPHCQARTTLKPPGAPVAVSPVPPAPPAAPSPQPVVTASVVQPVAASPPRPPAPRPAAPPPPRPPVPIQEAEVVVEVQKPRSKKGLTVTIIVGLLALAVVGYVGYKQFLEQPPLESAGPVPRPKKKEKTAVATRPAASETSTPPSTTNSIAPGVAKSAQDLKAGAVVLEKSKGGSSLVYAVSTIRNESDYQRFGVKVEVDVFDATGKRVGKATDYIQLIEPRDSWKFHALVLEPKAASAKIASIKEDE